MNYEHPKTYCLNWQDLDEILTRKTASNLEIGTPLDYSSRKGDLTQEDLQNVARDLIKPGVPDEEKCAGCGKMCWNFSATKEEGFLCWECAEVTIQDFWIGETLCRGPMDKYGNVVGMFGRKEGMMELEKRMRNET